MASVRGTIHGGRFFGGKSRMASYFLTFSLVGTFTLMGVGGFLLYDAASQRTNTQLAEVLGGAVLVALGLLILFPQVRLAIHWLKEARANFSRSH
jgi:hypothetical protein